MGGEIDFVLCGITDPTIPKNSMDSDELDLHLGDFHYFVQKKNYLSEIWPLKVSERHTPTYIH